MNDLLRNNSNFKYSKKTARNILVIVFVYGIQELLRTQFFRCPCKNYALYSFIMVAAPMFFLLGIGFSSSDGYWSIVSRRKHITNNKLRLNYCLRSLPSLFEPFLPAAAFIVFVLMRGEYYACAKIGGRDGTCLAKQGLEQNLKISRDLESHSCTYTG
ncbi:uncharacterized protein LOC116300797 [Actinia tenebrosa]|uniref:Uncharacterized protein LOC116300797 n=1 Tax=Actinia tenebrosa TaxID=6105 RepID=A0A6P8IFY3_ACTTE|nr:uncharacterized protein LOC116300797 [Actinia tenebrosa]